MLWSSYVAICMTCFASVWLPVSSHWLHDAVLLVCLQEAKRQAAADEESDEELDEFGNMVRRVREPPLLETAGGAASTRPVWQGNIRVFGDPNKPPRVRDMPRRDLQWGVENNVVCCAVGCGEQPCALCMVFGWLLRLGCLTTQLPNHFVAALFLSLLSGL